MRLLFNRAHFLQPAAIMWMKLYWAHKVYWAHCTNGGGAAQEVELYSGGWRGCRFDPTLGVSKCP